MPKDDKKDPTVEEEIIEEKAKDETVNAEVEAVKKQLTEQEEITRRAQSDYLRTKLEFDAYVKRSDAARLWFEIDGLMKALEKVLPFVNQLKTTLDNLPEDISWHAWVEWVQLLYTKMLADIALLWVKPIEVTLWTDPDYTVHIPIGVEETDDESLKNKVVKEVEGGFVYEKGEVNRVVMPAKVVVGS